MYDIILFTSGVCRYFLNLFQNIQKNMVKIHFSHLCNAHITKVAQNAVANFYVGQLKEFAKIICYQNDRFVRPSWHSFR